MCERENLQLRDRMLVIADRATQEVGELRGRERDESRIERERE